MAKQPKTFKQSPFWKTPQDSKTVKLMQQTISQFVNALQNNGRVKMQHAVNASDGYHVPFPKGNSKLGTMFSTVSLCPVIDCGNCSKCSGQCYDLRHDVTNKPCMELRCLTTAILEVDPERYWSEVEAQARLSMFFRFHIGGDIKDKDYMKHLRIVAERCPMCNFLLFTKMYDLVNDDITECGPLPDNIFLFFSMWPGVEMNNPYNLPVTFPIFSKEDCDKYPELAEFMARTPKFFWMCNDDCTDCAICAVNPTGDNKGQGCFRLGKGDAVGFNYH